MDESAWKRGKRDSWDWLSSSNAIFPWLVVTILSAVVAALSDPNAGNVETAIRAGIGLVVGAVGFLALTGLTFILNIAPRRQRDEARERLRERDSAPAFEASLPLISITTPISFGSDGTPHASRAIAGTTPIAIVHHGEVTNVQSVIADVDLRFTESDGGRSTSDPSAMWIAPMAVPVAGLADPDCSWNTQNPRHWTLSGLPRAVRDAEPILVPGFGLRIENAVKVMEFFKRNASATFSAQFTLRTDRGSFSTERMTVDVLPPARPRLSPQSTPSTSEDQQ